MPARVAGMNINFSESMARMALMDLSITSMATAVSLQFAPYKFILKDSNDVTLGTWDNVSGVGASETVAENFTGDGSTVAFTLDAAPYSENAMFVYINGVYQQRNTYSVSSTTLTFSEAPPTTSSIEVLYN